MKRLATLLGLVVLVSVAGFVAPRPVSACSCAQLDPATGLAEYPAAFVGTLVDVSGQIGAFLDSGADTVYRFEVDEWVKGDLGDFVDVHSPAGGASCGIEVGVGNRTGVFLRVENGQLTSSLCSTIDADVLLAGSKPLQVGAPGPAVVLVSGNIGGFTYLILNEEGGIVAGINGPFAEAFQQPSQFSICPGGAVMVEQWDRGIVVRALSDLSIIRQVSLDDFAETTAVLSMRCVSRNGSEILVAGEEWNGKTSIARVFKITETIEPWIEIPGGQVWLGDTLAVIQDHQTNEISIVDYANTSTNVIFATPTNENGPFIGIAGIGISPDSSSIVLVEVEYQESEGSVSSVILFRADGSELSRQVLDGEASALTWLDDNRILVSRSLGDGREQVATILNATTLETELEIEDWHAWNPVILDQQMYASEGGAIVRANLSTGVVTSLSTLPTQYVGPIALLQEGFNVSPDLLGGDPETNTVATIPPLVSDEFGGGEAADVTNTARIILVILLVGATVAFAVPRRKSPTQN